MISKVSALLLLQLLFGVVGTQAQVSGLPSCASDCANRAASTAGCDAGDKTCLCKSTSFISAVQQCSVHSCSQSEQTTVSAVMRGFCPAATTATTTEVSTILPIPSPPGGHPTTGGNTETQTVTQTTGGGGGGGTTDGGDGETTVTTGAGGGNTGTIQTVTNPSATTVASATVSATPSPPSTTVTPSILSVTSSSTIAGGAQTSAPSKADGKVEVNFVIWTVLAGLVGFGAMLV